MSFVSLAVGATAVIGMSADAGRFGAEDRLSEAATGLWKSVGYGQYLVITADQFETYEVTDISCLKVDAAPLDELVLEVGRNGQTLTLVEGFDAYAFTRVEALPAFCLTPYNEMESRDPLVNFDIFAQTISEHFAYFGMTETDWPGLRRDQRRLLLETPTDQQLYRAMDTILTTLPDEHGDFTPSSSFQADDAVNDDPSSEAPSDTLRSYGDLEIAGIVARNHLGEADIKGNAVFRWGRLTETVGYIQLNAMFLHAAFPEQADRIDEVGYFTVYNEQFEIISRRERLEREIAGLAAKMQDAVQDLRDVDQIIFDLRFNGGGLDEVGLAALSYLTGERTQFGTKEARLGEGFTEPHALYIDPVDAPYVKPVLVLVSPQTGSAAEIFTMAARRLDHVQIAGSPTMGATSDSFYRQLPNGWTFSISNEIYRDMAGVSYEYVGMPVDLELGYSRDRQTFFRAIAEGLDADRQTLLSLARGRD